MGRGKHPIRRVAGQSASPNPAQSHLLSPKRIDSEGVKQMQIYNRLYNAFGPQHWWPAESRFEVIVGAILTQNTSWKNVEKAQKSLKEKAMLDPEKLYHIPQNKLAMLIRSSGFYNIKARRLKAFMTFLYDEYDGSLDRMFEEEADLLREKLLFVKGLGPETVDSILLYAGDKPYFVVDAYTRRVFSRHSLVSEKSSYAEMQTFFMKRLPLDVSLFNEYHALIVSVGKVFCKTIPDCENCPLGDLLEKEDYGSAF
jgi:endonuclease-3 related protein